MSRTKRNRGKPPGYDWWSRRPGSSYGPGKGAKRLAHHKERAVEKQKLKKELDNV